MVELLPTKILIVFPGCQPESNSAHREPPCLGQLAEPIVGKGREQNACLCGHNLGVSVLGIAYLLKVSLVTSV